jgi:hypothetical protein
VTILDDTGGEFDGLTAALLCPVEGVEDVVVAAVLMPGCIRSR